MPEVLAQKSFVQGCIITNQNDTLRGMVKDRTLGFESKVYKKIRFRSDAPFASRHNAYHIKGYCKENTCFESHWIDKRQRLLKTDFVSSAGSGKKVFLKVIVRGELTLYHWEFTDGDNLTTDYMELFKRTGDDYFVRASQGILGLKKKLLSDYLKDRPDIVEQINNGTLKTARDVAKAYND